MGSAKTTVSLLCRMYEVLSRARIFSVGTTLGIMLQNENESSSTGPHSMFDFMDRHATLKFGLFGSQTWCCLQQL